MSDFGMPSAVPISAAPPPALDLMEEKTRKEAAMADKLELANAETRKELVRAEEVEAAWGAIVTRVKTRILQVPYTAAKMVVGQNDVLKVQEVIKEVINDALNELSADWRDGVQEEDEADDG